MVIGVFPAQPISFTFGEDITYESDADRLSLYGYNGLLSLNLERTKQGFSLIKDVQNRLHQHLPNLMQQESPAISFGFKKDDIQVNIAAYNREDLEQIVEIIDTLVDKFSMLNEQGLLLDGIEKQVIQEVENGFI